MWHDDLIAFSTRGVVPKLRANIFGENSAANTRHPEAKIGEARLFLLHLCRVFAAGFSPRTWALNLGTTPRVLTMARRQLKNWQKKAPAAPCGSKTLVKTWIFIFFQNIFETEEGIVGVQYFVLLWPCILALAKQCTMRIGLQGGIVVVQYLVHLCALYLQRQMQRLVDLYGFPGILAEITKKKKNEKSAIFHFFVFFVFFFFFFIF